MAVTVPIYLKLGSEFMPPLNEGDVMFMPVTDPAISIDEALKIMAKQDEMLKSFPEVEWAVGGHRSSLCSWPYVLRLTR